MKPPYAYPWPASALSAEDMAVLYLVRENTHPRVPITELVARAVRSAYAVPAGRPTHARGPHTTVHPVPSTPATLKEAA